MKRTRRRKVTVTRRVGVNAGSYFDQKITLSVTAMSGQEEIAIRGELGLQCCRLLIRDLRTAMKTTCTDMAAQALEELRRSEEPV